MILVTGAAGKTGRAVIRELAAVGAPVRALVHHPDQARVVEDAGAGHTIVGDMRHGAALAEAMAGVRAVYHICPNVNPAEVAIGRSMMAAASAAGAERFIYHSVLHPQTQAMPHHWHKMRVEELLFESGLDFTILQPAPYMQNVLAGWRGIVEEGTYAVPYPVETRLSMVDLGDVARAARAVLTEPGHAAAIYELSGPEPLTQVRVAEVLSRRLGRPVRATEIAVDSWIDSARAAGMGAYQVDTLAAMFRYYARYGLCGNPRVLAQVIGRPPVTFATFVDGVLAQGGETTRR